MTGFSHHSTCTDTIFPIARTHNLRLIGTIRIHCRYDDPTPIEGGQLRAFVTAIDAMDYRGISDRGAQYPLSLMICTLHRANRIDMHHCFLHT